MYAELSLDHQLFERSAHKALKASLTGRVKDWDVLNQKLGFTFGEPWEGFYAVGVLDGLELHLKEAPQNDADHQHRRNNDHLDASAGVDGVEAFYEQCVANGVTIIKPITATEWGTKGFYVEDPDGHIIGFGGRPAAG